MNSYLKTSGKFISKSDCEFYCNAELEVIDSADKMHRIFCDPIHVTGGPFFDFILKLQSSRKKSRS